MLSEQILRATKSFKLSNCLCYNNLTVPEKFTDGYCLFEKTYTCVAAEVQQKAN